MRVPLTMEEVQRAKVPLWIINRDAGTTGVGTVGAPGRLFRRWVTITRLDGYGHKTRTERVRLKDYGIRWTCYEVEEWQHGK